MIVFITATSRECEILRLMADGLIKKEIADALRISIHTVFTHMQRVYEKLSTSAPTPARSPRHCANG